MTFLGLQRLYSMNAPLMVSLEEYSGLFRPRFRPARGLPNQMRTVGKEPDDATLVIAAQADPQAFGLLYERHVRTVYGYCYVRLGDREAAEDTTSEVFLKALANLHRFRDGTFAAWLFRIAHNTVVDAHRRRRPTQPIEGTGDPPDLSPTPEEAALRRAQREALRSAVAGLPDDQRAVIELQLAGWSGQRIAEVLGKTPAAVKMLRFRAVGRLRALSQHEIGLKGGPR